MRIVCFKNNTDLQSVRGASIIKDCKYATVRMSYVVRIFIYELLLLLSFVVRVCVCVCYASFVAC